MASLLYKEGSRWLQNCGEYLTIVKRLKRARCLVKFDFSEEFEACSYKVGKGIIDAKLKPTLYGVGYMARGKYPSKIKGKRTPYYEVWRGMLRRCYDKNNIQYPQYGGKGVVVCKEWHNFQNFARWYEDKSIEGYALDKDLLDYQVKMYSPKTCSFIPIQINTLFTGGFKSIVYLRRGKWVVQLQKGEKCSNGNKRQSYFGEYRCREEALSVYFEEKMKHIKGVVEKFKGVIDERVVENLLDREWVEEYINYLSEEACRSDPLKQLECIESD